MTSANRIALEIFAGAAAVCFVSGFWIRRGETVARRWPRVSGKIIVSRAERRWTGQPGLYEVFPIIEYEFTYLGRTFTSSHWRFGNYSVGNSDETAAINSRYPVGSSVAVFVNENNPINSVLEHSATPLSWIPIGFGIAFALLSLIPLLTK
jgi:hypothetical protein